MNPMMIAALMAGAWSNALALGQPLYFVQGVGTDNVVITASGPVPQVINGPPFFCVNCDSNPGGTDGFFFGGSAKNNGLKLYAEVDNLDDPSSFQAVVAKAEVKFDDVTFLSSDPNQNSTVIRLTVNAHAQITSIIPIGGPSASPMGSFSILIIENGQVIAGAGSPTIDVNNPLFNQPLVVQGTVPIGVPITVQAKLLISADATQGAYVEFDAANSMDFDVEQVFELEEGVSVNSEGWGVVDNTISTCCLGNATQEPAGIVDFGDVTAVLGHWLSVDESGSAIGDANCDGVVDFGDVTAVLGNWLAQCP